MPFRAALAAVDKEIALLLSLRDEAGSPEEVEAIDDGLAAARAHRRALVRTRA